MPRAALLEREFGTEALIAIIAGGGATCCGLIWAFMAWQPESKLDNNQVLTQKRALRKEQARFSLVRNIPVRTRESGSALRQS